MSRTEIIVIVCILMGICLCGCAVCGMGGYVFWKIGEITPVAVDPAISTPVVIRSSATARPTDEPHALNTPGHPGVTSLPAMTATLAPTAVGQAVATLAGVPTPPSFPTLVSAVPSDTLLTLQQADVPENNLRQIAERLLGKKDIPETLLDPDAPYQVGDRKSFFLNNTDTNENFQVEAVLRYETAHTYFWVENGVRYDEGDLRDLAETFEEKIYPTDREFFGSEWSPGVDGDVHLYIIYADDLGSTLAGYYSSSDEYHPDAHKYSNAHEAFVFNADNVGLEESFTYGVLAHEFQHMIHWHRDRNEATWLNEGFADLASFLNGYYGPFGADWSFIDDTDLQLTDWPNDADATYPHYGASFLFLAYFLDRFGNTATQAVVADPANGMASIDNILGQIGATDALTGQTIHSEDVFLDWVIANYLQDGDVGDGRYVYHNYPNAPQAQATETISSCPSAWRTRDVNQFGTDYYRITCSGNYTLHFEGSVQVGVVPADAHSGKYAFWSNKGDESDMTLTQQFDFTSQDGPLSLEYWTWYDLEEDYDYLYLEASADGQSWQILQTPDCTTDDPSGNSYGCGYNGTSGSGAQARWIQQQIDLSQFAGQKVWLRFEYITDAAVNGEGLLLDDVTIPQIGYATDFEQDLGGWEAAGFVRIENILPQNFRLALIAKGHDTTVTYITLNEDVSADIPLNLSGDVDEVTLVVTGVTPFTRQKAAYRFEIVP